MDGTVVDAFKLLQRQMKAGLVTGPALAMYEVGFADREIAKDLRPHSRKSQILPVRAHGCERTVISPVA